MDDKNITFDSNSCKHYLQTLFPDDGDALVSVCWKNDRGFQSKFLRPSNGTILNGIERLARNGDVWNSICLFSHRPGQGRGSELDVALMPGVWMDIDTSEGEHSKKGLPSKNDALQFIKTLPWISSLIVHSGGGLHVYWLFKEPQVIESEDDRAALKSLSERFQKYIIALMKEKGWACDSTFDLARVLRPAGTWNFKTNPPKPVTIIEESERRYEPDDFEMYLPQGESRNRDQGPDQEATGGAQPQGFDVERLPFSIRELIRVGSELGRRSEAQASVLVALIKAGASDNEIVQIFEANPQGIGEKYFEYGAGRDKWLRDDIARCRDFSNNPQDEWPEPKQIEMTLPPVMPLLHEMIPTPFKPLVTDEAHRMCVPIDYICVPLIVVCGSLIGTACRIKPKRRDDWAVVPNLWGALIGPPSRLKTPALDVAIKKMLGRLEAEAAEEHKTRMMFFEDEKRKFKLAKTVLEQEYKAALKEERNPKVKGSDNEKIE